jgi:ribosomal protein RSM22 (predicted rRNA methylase)
MKKQKIIQLPQELTSSITTLLQGETNTNWLHAALRLSEQYRDQAHYGAPKALSQQEDFLSYLAVRLPATFAQVYGACAQIQELLPSWKPSSLLDIGSGPGTSAWASKAIWPSINKIVNLEKEQQFIDIGKQLTESLQPCELLWKRQDVTKSKIKITEPFDLIIVANVLNELAKETRESVVKQVVAACTGVCIFVEPGTSFGNKIIDETAQIINARVTPLLAPFVNKHFFRSQ